MFLMVSCRIPADDRPIYTMFLMVSGRIPADDRPIYTTIHGKCKRHYFFYRKLTRMDSDS